MGFNKKRAFSAFLALGIVTLGMTTAEAMPSFSRQTGDPCSACHIGAFGPQLTPHGIAFKLSGYTNNNGNVNIPLSVMANATYTHTKKDINPPVGKYDPNNNTTLQEMSLFFAGKIANNLGAFAQYTYSQIDHSASLDHLDVRYAREVNLTADSKPAIVGLSLNNAPTVQDPFNSLPMWRYPYIGSALSNSPAYQTVMDSGLDGRLLGLTGYALLPNGIYGEVGAYKDQGRKMLQFENVQTDVKTKNLSPYARFAYYKPSRESSYSVGVVGLQSQLRPRDTDVSSYDRATDLGLDANYQYLGNRKHIFTGAMSYIYERQHRGQSYATGAAENLNGNLTTFNMNGSYTYDNTYGATLGLFNTTGSHDALYYAESAVGKPNSTGYILETDWTPFGKESSWMSPWANLKLGLQYTMYSKFNGSRKNYDGESSKASDNNTLATFLWMAF